MRKFRQLLRRFLGYDAEIERLDKQFAQHIESLDARITALTTVAETIATQLNLTTIGAADVTARLDYYEKHCETIRYAKSRRGAQGNGHILTLDGHRG